MRSKILVTVAVVLGSLSGFRSIGIAAGPPATIITWNGTPQTTAAGANFGVTLVAVVRDANGNGVQGATVTFSAPGGSAAGATFSGSPTATAISNASGAASAPTLTANGFGGSYSVTATVAGAAGSAIFSLTNTGGTSGGGTPQAPAGLRFFVAAGPPSSVTPSAGTPQSTTLNTGFSTLQALVKDASANPVSGASVTFTSPASGASALLGGSTSSTVITNTSGIATAAATANGTVGTYVVTASVAGVATPASFSLTNVAVPTGGGGGTWVDVTPPGISLDPNGTVAGASNNYGVQGVHADPSRPGTFYASVTYQGLWKSTDYGLTWSKVVVTSGPNPMDNGRPNLDVASDGSYLISTALYPINGISNGAWKSLNGGQTWTRYNVGAPNGDDMGQFAIHPTNTSRVVGRPHSSPYHLFESRDGGQTWTDQGSMGGATSADVSWIDDDTLLAISDGDSGTGNGTWRGVRSGSTWPWTWTWTYVSTQQHWHGDSQAYIDPTTKAIFTGGGHGIQKSTDGGRTWTTVSSTNSGSLVGTGTNIYSTANYATGGTFGPWLMHSSRATGGVSWVADTNPANFDNGWLYAAAAFNGTKWVVVGGNWLAGIWRMVEP